MHVLSSLCMYLHKKYHSPIAVIAGIGCASYSILDAPLPLIFRPAVEHLPFFIVGITAGRFGALRHVPVGMAAVGALFFLGAETVALSSPNRLAGISDLLVGFLAVIGVSLTISWMTTKFPRTTFALSFFGRLTMPVFVAHVFVQAAIRALLLKIGVSSAAVHIAIGFLFALMAPIAMYFVTEKLRLSRFLGLPQNALSPVGRTKRVDTTQNFDRKFRRTIVY